MDVILGATGRVGSLLVAALLARGRAVRAVVRNPAKAARLAEQGATLATADFGDAAAVQAAFAGGDTVFVVTAEDPASPDGLAEARAFLDACRAGVQAAGVRRVVGLSSDGAQHAAGTGTLVVSYLLEHAFDGLDLEATFIRPSYYYSNWLTSLPLVRESGILPSFFSADFAMHMIAPDDVAGYAAAVIAGETESRRIHHITGPVEYTPADIAATLAELLDRPVRVETAPRDAWLDILQGSGFSPGNARHMVEMTEAVLDGRTAADGPETVLPTTFADYARPLLVQ